MIVCKDYSDSWSQDGRYLPVGHDHEVLPQSYCVVGKNCPATWDALPEKLRGLDLEELNAKCRYVYEDQETQLVRDGWGELAVCPPGRKTASGLAADRLWRTGAQGKGK